MATDEERIRDIYKTYIEVICPYIIRYETLSDRFPSEILNKKYNIYSYWYHRAGNRCTWYNYWNYFLKRKMSRTVTVIQPALYKTQNSPDQNKQK